MPYRLFNPCNPCCETRGKKILILGGLGSIFNYRDFVGLLYILYNQMLDAGYDKDKITNWFRGDGYSNPRIDETQVIILPSIHHIYIETITSGNDFKGFLEKFSVIYLMSYSFINDLDLSFIHDWLKVGNRRFILATNGYGLFVDTDNVLDTAMNYIISGLETDMRVYSYEDVIISVFCTGPFGILNPHTEEAGSSYYLSSGTTLSFEDPRIGGEFVPNKHKFLVGGTSLFGDRVGVIKYHGSEIIVFSENTPLSCLYRDFREYGVPLLNPSQPQGTNEAFIRRLWPHNIAGGVPVQ